ncbi:phosphopyruvate hydratase [Burkholderia pseudomallei 406e]|nr:phosphopyruvate hydratase [Burkholderia pseudomallei 406e]
MRRTSRARAPPRGAPACRHPDSAHFVLLRRAARVSANGKPHRAERCRSRAAVAAVAAA